MLLLLRTACISTVSLLSGVGKKENMERVLMLCKAISRRNQTGNAGVGASKMDTGVNLVKPLDGKQLGDRPVKQNIFFKKDEIKLMVATKEHCIQILYTEINIKVFFSIYLVLRATQAASMSA